ncbi:MAG: DUF2294 family protein [Solirubrobacterales bacterium]|nr:DUF2294 family protein [Solirubrobacterales bacterium]
MASTTDERPTGGSVAAAISNAVVRIMSEYTGRGPTKARASIRDDLIVVLMQDTMTKGERSLYAAGDGDLVLQTRARYQHTMSQDLVAAVEMLTERKVIAFMSANHLDPDMAAETFVLEPAGATGEDGTESPEQSDRSR